MTNQELVAKTVFGEITLGDVIRKFKPDIQSIHIETDGVEVVVNSWKVSEKNLKLYNDYDLEGCFDLETKVKVYDDHLEFEHDGLEFYMSFLVTAKLSSLIPGGKK